MHWIPTVPTLALAFAGGLLPLTAAAAAPAETDSLQGLWATQLDFGPAIRGDLELARRGDAWRATIAGREVTFPASGDSLRFALPDDLGGFRGSRRGRDVEGYWLQPPGTAADNRGGSSQRFATPITLRPAGPDRWRGTVRPLDDRFTLYLKIYRTQGVLAGAFRNPEVNSNGGATLLRMFRQGDSLRFCVRPDSAAPYECYVRGSVAQSPERIRVWWSDLGRELELTRRDPSQAASFFPRAPGDTAYAYRKPPATDDGWPTARARDAGMDEATLERLVRRLVRLDPAMRRAPLIHSLLVAYRGKLVLEEYFFGYDRDTPHDTRSAGKTLGSVMLGAAMRQGLPVGPDTPVYRVLEPRGSFAHSDPRKARITVAHLLTHTSGLACDDNNDDSPGNENTMQSQRTEPDWWKYTLDLPMAHEPGARYAYCSANSNLVGAVLTTVTGTWLPEYFGRALARPLQFGRWHWNLQPTGEGYLGGGAFLRPRDLLKVGQLFLDDGVWQGRRVVDSSWVALSTAAHMRISPATTGLDPEEFGNFYGEADEGYAWHRWRLRAAEREYPAYAATGNGGQILMVVPELDLTVVFTAGNYRQGGIWIPFGSQIIPQEIIPAIRR